MKRIVAIAVACVLLFTGIGVGQTTPSDSTSTDAFRFFDSPIDPDRYLIRPGEVLRVTFAGAQLAPLVLTVDPEGRIVHQTIGSFDLRGATLSVARERLAAALARLYNVETIIISIGTVRRVGIQVSGSVKSPGLYLAYTSQRVSELIDSSHGVAPRGSRRQIRLVGGPKDIPVDLDRALYLGEDEWDPPLYAGYTVLVPPKSGRIVNVVGEVDRPCEVEFVDGETVEDMLRLAGGLRATADSAGITLIRGAERLDPVSSGLRPGDIIFVPPASASAHPVVVFGAVNRPGRYPLEGAATLEDLVGWVQGFTETAAATELTLFRRVPLEATMRAGERFPIANLVDGDGGIRPFQLLPADSIFVPVKVGYVKISGEVLNPGLFPYQPGKAVLDYIMAAGGFLPTANRTSVDIFHRISRLTDAESVEVTMHDGDEVIVRRREELQ